MYYTHLYACGVWCICMCGPSIYVEYSALCEMLCVDNNKLIVYMYTLYMYSNPEAYITLRWYSTWCLIFAMVTVGVLYIIWLPMQLLGRLSHDEAVEVKRQVVEAHKIPLQPPLSHQEEGGFAGHAATASHLPQHVLPAHNINGATATRQNDEVINILHTNPAATTTVTSSKKSQMSHNSDHMNNDILLHEDRFTLENI